MKELKYEFYVGGTPAQVWQSLIAPEQVKQIYYGCVIRSSFKRGELLEYVGPGAEGDGTVHVYGTLLEYIPEQVLSFIHKVGPSYLKGGEPYESRITWRLKPAGGCTKLTLTHDGWHPDDPFYAASDSAWWQILSNIKTLVETGRTLEFSSGE
ncbi:SRPBCC domain-containing protein [Paenibacillus sp. HW567]|uniref:SRPBCC domain-containing protein n=1 Tax=Paenibacillus sp. HW567 TaxID=1034769 RepID=UPI00048CEAAB|nr:SRPBCC domain-containing protein [Paenibacillus sp. HW567]